MLCLYDCTIESLGRVSVFIRAALLEPTIRFLNFSGTGNGEILSRFLTLIGLKNVASGMFLSWPDPAPLFMTLITFR